MALNLGTSPYYDDFDIEKNFHRILFKPGYAVQARELTQLQTILQNQIERFGNHIFKDGSVVLGCAETFQFSVPYVKIKDENSAGVTITAANYATYQTSLVGATISNEAGVNAKILLVEFDPVSEQKVLYLNYQTASADGASTEFLADDVLTVVDVSNNTLSSRFVAKSSLPTGFGSLYTIADGIVYAEGNFIRHVETTKVLDYFSSTPSKNVGFRIVSETVTSEDDVSLLDPAAGSYNYSAPGADRYKLSTQLESNSLSTVPDEGFHLLFVVDTGEIKRAYNKPQYAELQKVLAQRTFDESGNYTVRGLNVVVREHLKTANNNGRYTSGDSSKLLYGIEPGKAYVEGYDAELKSTEYLPISKATDTLLLEEKIISSTYGNYVYVKDVSGDWNIGDTNLVVNLKAGGLLGTTMATARVQLLRHHMGPPGTGPTSYYKLYLYEITPASTYTIDDLGPVDTITDGSLNDATVAITPGDSLGTGIIQTGFTTHESSYNTLLFSTPVRAVEHYEDDTDYFFWKKLGDTYSGTISNPNRIDLSLSGTGITFTTSVAPSGPENIARHFLVVNNTTGNILAVTDIPTSTSDYQLGNANLLFSAPITGNHTVYAYVKQTNGAPVGLTLTNSILRSNLQTFTGPSFDNLEANKIYLGVSYAFDVEAVYMADHTSTWPATYALVTTDANWTDVTEDFNLVINQDDNVFRTSYLEYTGASTLSQKKIVVKFRNFLRDSSFGYINKNSYASALIDFDPLNPDTGKQIYTYQLPLHTSKNTGITYDLRDAIDFRPAMQNRSNYSGSAYGVSEIVDGENVPVTTIDVSTGAGGLVIPDPDSVITTSFTVNLPRQDKVVLTKDGEFKVITGISALYPKVPADAADSMTLATIELAPYPSMSTYASRVYEREDYASVIRLADNRRFTMRDIGNLEQRVNRLEYYTALSIMENKVANMFIADSVGDAMVKKGILVDGFDGHDVGNVFDTNYNVAIDVKNKEMRAPISIEDVNFQVVSGGHQQGSLVLNGIAHTHVNFINNSAASKGRVCGNSLLRNYKSGNLYLDPQQDMWLDENIRPDVQLNYNNTNDGWMYDNTPFNIHWNSWLNNWQGIDTEYLSPVINSVNGILGARSYNQSTKFVSDVTRSAITAMRLPEHNIRVVGNKLLDISVVPYIREQVITFIATELKPNTIVKAYFDGEDVSENCRYFTLPTGVTKDTIKNLKAALLASKYEATASNYGDDLIVNSNGLLVGQFLIPANKFRTGSKIFKLEDVASTTLAATQFQNSGLANFNEGSIFSTRFTDFRQDSLTSAQNKVVERLIVSNPSSFDASSYGDPMAQTFIVEGETHGAFITKLDLYFRTKSATKAFTVQIREVVNGYPGDKILPFSTKTLPSSSINTSETASVATTFTFESPVFLKNNTEYSLVLLPENNDPDYQVWVSELGQRKIGSSETITQQPYVGVLFVPNNNTIWSALETEDLKFTLYKGEFTTADTIISMKSDPIDYITFSSSGEHVLAPGDVVKVYDDTQSSIYGTVSISGNVVSGEPLEAPITTFTTQTAVGDRLRVLITNVSGTISVTGTSVAGVGTSFNTQLQVGDILYKTDNTVIGKVASITDENNLTLETAGPTVSAENYKVRKILGVVKDVVSNNSLILEEPYTFSAPLGNYTIYKDGTSGVGVVQEVQDNTAKIYITSGFLASGNSFQVRTAVTGDTSPTKYTVNSIDTRIVTTLVPNFSSLELDPATSVTLKYKLKDALGMQQAVFTTCKNGDTIELEQPYTVFSYSSPSYGEHITGTPAISMQAVLHTDSSSLTPVLDTRKLSLLAVGNLINYNGASEAIAQYVTRAVTMSGNSNELPDDLRVFMDIKMPENCSVRVFAKLQNNVDDGLFEDVPEIEMTEHAPLIINRTEFQEYMYSLPSIVADYFKFAIRVELYSGNSSSTLDVSKTPLIKNFRAVALI
jgi:hypothetical protein